MSYKTIDVTKPIDGRIVVTNKYWLCKDSDPKQAIFYSHSAQCNSHKQIPERMKNYTEEQTGWKTEVVFIEIAYKPNYKYD